MKNATRSLLVAVFTALVMSAGLASSASAQCSLDSDLSGYNPSLDQEVETYAGCNTGSAWFACMARAQYYIDNWGVDPDNIECLFPWQQGNSYLGVYVCYSDPTPCNGDEELAALARSDARNEHLPSPNLGDAPGPV